MINLRKPTIVGKSMVRVEGQLKTTGQARYLDDLRFDVEPLVARLVLGRRPHADFSLDVGDAAAMPGVAAVLTGRDLPGMLGRRLFDRPLLALNRVLYSGQPIAAVAAETPEIAAAAAGAVRIDYVERPAVFDLAQALDPAAPRLHDGLASNIAFESQASRGDLEAGWRRAEVIIEGVYAVAPTHHMAMEPHGAVAVAAADGTVTLWAAAQNPSLHQQMICQALGLATERLRVLTSYVGGSFGGKSFASIEALAVALALALPGRPVKLALTRAEDLNSTFTRPGLSARLKLGATADGALTALAAMYEWDAGASADALVEMIETVVHTGAGPYRIPHVTIGARAVYSNRTPSAPMRGNGMVEVQWAVEQHIDRLAQAIGADAVEFRLQNCLIGGDRLFDLGKMHATGLDVCLRRVAKAVHWSKAPVRTGPAHKRRGVGVAIGWNPVLEVAGDTPASARASIVLETAPAGPVSLAVSGVDIGQGLHTVAVQLAASALGVPLNWVQVRPSAASMHGGIEQMPRNQLTWSAGNAIVRAAGALRLGILAWAARAWSESPGSLDIVEGEIISHASGRRLSLLDYIHAAGAEAAVEPDPRPLSAEGLFQPDPPTDKGFPVTVAQIGVGAQAAEVEVDMETGEVQVLRLVSAFDAGHAINPDIVEAQIRGGALQGLSAALFETMVPAAGAPPLRSLADYHIATIREAPASLEAITVEVPEDTGPFGARGVGEHTAIAAAPAIANAIYRATGARVNRLPISGESIWIALHSQANAPEATST